MPKVSIIVPVYNTSKYLKRCMDALVNQTLKEIEIIAVNDGSTDDSPAILEEYAAYNAYAIGLLTLPSFFIMSICQILIPEVSKYKSEQNTLMLKKRIKQAISYSFFHRNN